MFLMRHCCVKFVLDIKTHEFLVVVSTKNSSHYVVTFENPTLVTCISQKFRTVRKSVSSVRFPSSNWPNSNPPVDCWQNSVTRKRKYWNSSQKNSMIESSENTARQLSGVTYGGFARWHCDWKTTTSTESTHPTKSPWRYPKFLVLWLHPGSFILFQHEKIAFAQLERRWRLETRWSVVSSFIHTTQRSRSIKEANHAIERGECERANANKQRGPFTIAESNLKLIGSKQFGDCNVKGFRGTTIACYFSESCKYRPFQSISWHHCME